MLRAEHDLTVLCLQLLDSGSIGGYLTIFHGWQKQSTYEIQQTSN